MVLENNQKPTLGNEPNAKIGCIVSVVCALLSGVILVGLPGGLFLTIAFYLLEAFAGQSYEIGEKAWPLAIFISLLWPVSFVPLTKFVYKINPRLSPIKRNILTFLFSFLFGIAVAFILIIINSI